MRHLKRRLALWVMALSLCLMVLLPPALAEDGVRALFINVGKADAALLMLGDQRYLVDTGTKGSHEQLTRVLAAMGVTHLDGVFITHTDKDHAGGLKKLLKSGMPVDRLYTNALHSEDSDGEHPAQEASGKYGVPLTWLSAGEELALGGDCSLRVLGPLTRDMEKENNNSLVLHLTTPEGTLLLTGDMELPEEAALMSAGLIGPADVLKVPHHGEDDATSLSFVFTVRPKCAVISTNTEEEPDTPSGRVLRHLTDADCAIAVTQDAEVGILVTLEDGMPSMTSLNWVDME